MDVLREREVKDSLERQLQDEQKIRGEFSLMLFATRAREIYNKRRNYQLFSTVHRKIVHLPQRMFYIIKVSLFYTPIRIYDIYFINY